ncbi:MAG: MFS transporter [Silvibacterium sp.]
MDVLLQQPAAPDTRGADSFWSNPLAWLRQKKLGRAFWVFFTAAFFFDAGFAVYFFLFNLYLLDCGFKERAIGLVGGAFTFGTVLGTLPAGLLARKIGVRRLLVYCFVAAPLMNAVRTVWMVEAAQVGFAFLAGLAMCTWGVCYLPAIARLTTEENRASAFGLIYSVSIGTSALGGLVCGYLPQWLRMAGFVMQGVEVKRLILQVSCGIALVGLIAVLRLRIPSQTAPDALAEIQPSGRSWSGGWKLHPFLLRFLPLMALWSAILAAFTPFANVYLARHLHIPFARIGLIFSSAQLVQLCFGLLTPVVFRLLGLINGIVATQIAAAVALALMAGVSDERLAVPFYLTFYAAQWMSNPGLYNLLMTETPDKERSTAAAMTLLCNALAGSAATAGAGILFARFGYPLTLLGIALLALAAAILFRILIAPQSRNVAVQP